jgi:enoyl-CoA hydratase/carnithine racemase
MFEINLRGPAKNALGSEMLGWLLAQLASARGEPVLLTGSRDAFSAGLDLKEVAALDAAGMERYLRLLERCMAAVYLHPAPVVAAVEGHAIAGGCVLAACCDHRVATTDPRARIGLNEVALGVRYPPRVFHIVQQRVPRAAHETVFLGAGLFSPTEARVHGLVDELADDALATARARAEALAAHPRDAYAATKRAMRGATDADLAPDDIEDRWMRDSVAVWTSPALKERVLAVLRK